MAKLEIELRPEEELRLTREAAQEGLTITEYARRRLLPDTLDLADAPRGRFTWEDGPALVGDGTNSLSDELRRQRDGK